MRNRFILLIALAALISPLASAGLVAQLVSVTSASPSFPGDYFWDYSLTVSSGDVVPSGGFFTIYDVPLLVTVEAPSGWSGSSAFLGTTPTGLSPTDDPSIKNVTFTSSAEFAGSGQTITSFRFVSGYGNVASGTYSWQDAGSTGGTQKDLGSVGVPSATTSSVPEPSSHALLATGLAGIAFALRTLRPRPRQRTST